MVTGNSNDAGRIESGFTNEKNDCTVRAYAIMRNIPYIQAHGIFYLAGRRPKRGTNVHYAIYNKEFVRLNRPNMTVKRFIEFYASTGRWIIQIRGHVFAVVDGCIQDQNPMANLNCHVLMSWMHNPLLANARPK